MVNYILSYQDKNNYYFNTAVNNKHKTNVSYISIYWQNLRNNNYLWRIKEKTIKNAFESDLKMNY